MIRSHFALRRFAQTRFARASRMTFLLGLLAFALHVLPGPLQPRLAHAQGTRKDDIVFNSRGIPLAGATVRVCTMPAAGQPCTPLALIYSDPGLTQALANPTTTDGMGNYFFYAAPGQYEIEISGPQITTKQIPNVILPNDPASPNFNAVSAFSLSLGGNLTVSGNTTVVGNLASGTLNVTNQSTPPGTPATGTVNVYTKTADKRLYYKDDTGTEVGPLGPGNGAQTNVANTFTAPQNIDADFHTKGPNPSFDLLRYGGYLSGATPPTITCATTATSNQLTCSGVGDFQIGHGVAIPLAGPAPTVLTPGTPWPIASISVASNVATVTITGSSSFAPGTSIVVAGSSDATFNGTFSVASYTNQATFTYNVTHANCSPCTIGSSATVNFSTPSAVTPQGILNGSTTWNYKVVAIGFHAELSAASSAFTTTTGAATLGVNSAIIATNGCAENNGVLTITTTANHNFQAGSPVNIPRNSTGTLGVEGSWVIASVPSSTTFTVDNAMLTNGTYCPSGGTAQVVAKNLVQWTMQPYLVMGYYIYRAQGAGAYSLVGVAQGMDSSFIDWGLAAPTIPSYVPTTPPSTPTNGILATTITNISGNTVTLAANAVASVASATVTHDNTPNILAVCASTPIGTNGGTIFFSSSNPMGSAYLINSPLLLSTGCPQNMRYQLNAQLIVNYPILPNSGNTFVGGPEGAGGQGAAPSFVRYTTTRIQGNAYPMFLVETNNSSVTFQNFNIQCSRVYQSCFVQDQDNNGNNTADDTYDNVYTAGGNGSQPFKMGGGFNFNWRFGSINSAVSVWGVPPSLWDVADMGLGAFSQQLGGIVEFYYTWMGGGEWLFDAGGVSSLSAGPSHMTFYEVLNESSLYPAFRFNLGNNAAFSIHIERLTYADLIGGLATPLIDVTASSRLDGFRVVEPTCATGQQGLFSGAPQGGIELLNSGFGGCAPGLPSATPIISTNLGSPNLTRTYANVPVSATGTGQFFVPLAIPAAPSLVVTSGGSVPVGPHTYTITAMDLSGNQTTVGASASATASSGNQTITVTPPALPSGAVGYVPYRDGVQASTPGCSGIPGAMPFVDTFAGACGQSQPGANTAAASALNSNGFVSYQLKMANNLTDTIAPTPLSANRTQTLPDASGIVPVSSYLNSSYDNAHRANGAIGANWTVTHGGINVSSNALVGTGSGSDNSAVWSAGSFSPFGQFAEATVASLNGTSDFVGPTVMNSASAANFYDCIEDTTTLIIQRVTAAAGSNLSTATVTGAPGDVLRLEAFLTPNSFPQSVTLTCYQNGVQQLQTTDTGFTSGAPGVLLFNNVATLVNWSGGNLHPLAHLDQEQDWAKTQHFTQGIALGGVASESFNNNPRSEQNVFLPGALTSTWTGSTWTLDKAITVTRVQVQAKTAPAGCSTNAIVQLTNGSSPVNVTISAASNDSGAITQSYAAGAAITVAVQTAAAGCTTNPADANVVVQYRMQ